MQALKHYQMKTGRRITFEYALIGGVNDKIGHAAIYPHSDVSYKTTESMRDNTS